MRIAAGCLAVVGLILIPIDRVCAAEPERKDAFGDPLPPGAVARLGTTQFGLIYRSNTVDLAPDGQSYVEWRSGELLVRNTQMRVWPSTPSPYPETMILSGDGRAFLNHGWERNGQERIERIWVWDVQTGRKIQSIPPPSADSSPRRTPAPPGIIRTGPAATARS